MRIFKLILGIIMALPLILFGAFVAAVTVVGILVFGIVMGGVALIDEALD